MNNNLKRSLEERTDPTGTWLSIGHPAVAEVCASLDLEFVLIDTEHTSMHLETVENMVRAVDASDGNTETVVRVPWNDPVRLKRVLDLGVQGVMVPMIETAEEARTLIDATQYPPQGSRGIAGGRAASYGLNFEEYVKNANDSILTIVQIETKRGLENVEDIASVDGVDALFVGPADLSGSLGVFAEWESERLSSAIDRVISAGETTDTPAGTLVVNPDDVEMRVDQGFDYLIVGKDTASLAAATRDAMVSYDKARTESVDQPVGNE
ncbi:HpcH/HpaI aldolase family protein [Haladaptatus sp. NG-SE-30]